MLRMLLCVLGIVLARGAVWAGESKMPDGSAERPLRVMLVPADTGADTTREEFQPVFNAITQQYGIHFDLRAGSSYGAVVEGMTHRLVDLAFFGPVTFHQARERGAAELLAVGVSDGQSVYHAGIFVRKDSGIGSLAELRDKRVALGDVNSSSSFNFPLAMLLDAGVDPVKDIARVLITGSHSNAIAALRENRVDACGCSLIAYEKAVQNGVIDPREIVPLALSDPIPYPPLAVHPKLKEELKQRLREAFGKIHQAPGLSPDMIRGYGGRRLDRYDVEYPQVEFDKAVSKLALVTDELKGRLLEKSGSQ